MESARQPDDQDPLYPAAFRLARLYAILSPRILMNELQVDRPRAEAILGQLEAAGAVGATLITGTGARESRVNVVLDEARGGRAPHLIGTDARVGRRLAAIGGGAAALGLLLTFALEWVGAGAALARWFRVELASPTLFAVLTHTVPLIGLGLGWLAELPFRVEDDLAPHLYVRFRRLLWSTAGLVGVGAAIVRLLS